MVFGLTFLIFKLGGGSLFLVRGVNTRGKNNFQTLGATLYGLQGGNSGGILFILFCSIVHRIDIVYILYLYFENTSLIYRKTILSFFVLFYSLQQRSLCFLVELGIVVSVRFYNSRLSVKNQSFCSLSN